jgi:hypothetical protein
MGAFDQIPEGDAFQETVNHIPEFKPKWTGDVVLLPGAMEPLPKLVNRPLEFQYDCITKDSFLFWRKHATNHP